MKGICIRMKQGQEIRIEPWTSNGDSVYEIQMSRPGYGNVLFFQKDLAQYMSHLITGLN